MAENNPLTSQGDPSSDFQLPTDEGKDMKGRKIRNWFSKSWKDMNQLQI